MKLYVYNSTPRGVKNDFNNHEIFVKESYRYVQRNEVLTTDFEVQIIKMLKRVKAAKKLAQQANKKR